MTFELLQTALLPVARQPGEVLGEDVPVLDSLPDAEAWLAEHGGTVKCLITHAMRGASQYLINRLPGLELIANFGAGTDLIDLVHARERGVVVTASGDVLTDDVADLGFWLIMAVLRGNIDGHAFVRSLRWSEGNYPLGRGARGRRLGILGFGRIGQAIAARAAASGMKIGYHSRRPVPASGHHYHADAVALARWSEILVIALPGGDATRGLVDAEILKGLGPEGALVNIARGSIVDEEALASALEEGWLGAAALDVFENEPRINDRLRTAPRIILSPHIGSATADSRNAMLVHVTANIMRWRANEPVLGRL